VQEVDVRRLQQPDLRTDKEGKVSPAVDLDSASLTVRVLPAGARPADAPIGEEPPPPVATFFGALRGLAPANTVAGQQARLNNLGYFAGYEVADTVQLKWAVEEFQADHAKSHGLKVTGVVDEKTLNAIGAVHGDLPAGARSPAE
jgi:peptidoglycan hydrolase-like protein with peptidoglycan-binding domain